MSERILKSLEKSRKLKLLGAVVVSETMRGCNVSLVKADGAKLKGVADVQLLEGSVRFTEIQLTFHAYR